MNDQAKSNPETDTMSPEEMARYLMGFLPLLFGDRKWLPRLPIR